jgi:D-proline reductase (dithiol) PrdB
MVYLRELPPETRDGLLNQDLPTYADAAWVTGPPLNERRVAIVSTAGLHRSTDRPFALGSADYRIIPDDVDTNDLRLSHISTNFDRIGWQHDVNTVFPIDRLHELRDAGVIGACAGFHYSFMGQTPPDQLEATARQLAGILRDDRVDAVALIGV